MAEYRVMIRDRDDVLHDATLQTWPEVEAFAERVYPGSVLREDRSGWDVVKRVAGYGVVRVGTVGYSA